MTTPHLPNVVAVSRSLVTSRVPANAPNLDSLISKRLERDMAHAQSVIQPAIVYARERFGDALTCTGGTLSHLLAFYRDIRLLDPYRVRELTTVSNKTPLEAGFAILDSLTAGFPALQRHPERVSALKGELAAYVSAAMDAVRDPARADKRSDEVSDWWALHAARLPLFSTLMRDVALACPSSAAAERVFSVMRRSFGKGQKTSMEDYIELSCMLQYNYRT
jgi:hypothetical protein